MNNRQKYALTHPIDEAHMERVNTCRTVRELSDGMWSTMVLAVDR